MVTNAKILIEIYTYKTPQKITDGDRITIFNAIKQFDNFNDDFEENNLGNQF